MLLVLSVLLALLFILSGAAAVVQHNKLRRSRRRQARSLSLALAVSESYRQYVRHREPMELRNASNGLCPESR